MDNNFKMVEEKSIETSSTDGEVVREIHLKISPQYATISVIPKADEVNDVNFPRNLHNAAELFLRVGMVDNAKRLKERVDAMLNTYRENPDGKKNLKIGRASVCWNCGYCGLPKGYTDSSKNKQNPGPCNNCNEGTQTNWLRVTQQGVGASGSKKGAEIPWIEIAPCSDEDMQKKKEAEMAAKRAEIEANVKKAIQERERQVAEKELRDKE